MTGPTPISAPKTARARQDSEVGVVVVDDHPAVREGIRAMLESEQGLYPVGTVATAHDAVALVDRLRPEVIVVDYHLPDGDGLSLCLRLKSRGQAPAALLYSAFADEHLVPLAIVAGADGLLSKAADPEELCEAVRALAAGAPRMPDPAPPMMESVGSRLETGDLPILGMLAHGVSSAEIANTLRVPEPWLCARRWAMLERLTGGVGRRMSPRHHLPGR